MSRHDSAGGWPARLLAARAFVPISLALMLILFGGIGAGVMQRMGNWPPQFAQPRPTVVITGPGVDRLTTFQAYVLGAVRLPGVYTLPDTARIRDLIQAAGGALSTADLVRVNLASRVADGQSVYVPEVGEVVPLERGGKLDLNVASADEMHRALGISLTIARRIVAYRADHGNFTAVSQLLLVPISRTSYDRIKDLVTI